MSLEPQDIETMRPTLHLENQELQGIFYRHYTFYASMKISYTFNPHAEQAQKRRLQKRG